MANSITADQANALRGTWSIDPVHSSVEFSARHAMVATVRGHFEKFSGTITINPDDLERSAVEVEVDPSSLNTNNADRDAHLRSNDFLETEQHPALTFRSTRVEGSADSEEFAVVGDLTIRGVSQEVRLDLTFNGTAVDPFGNTRAGFEGETTINRKDFGVTWNASLETGGVLVGDRIKITLDVSAIKQQ